MAIDSKAFRQHASMELRLNRRVDRTTKELARAWASAWNEANSRYERAIMDLIKLGNGKWPSRAQLQNAKQAREILEMTHDQLTSLGKISGVKVSAQLPALTKDAEDFQRLVMLAQLPNTADIGLMIKRVDQAAIKAMIKRTTQSITSQLKPLAPDAVSAMKSSLIRGVMVGENPRLAASRMLARTKTIFDGGRWRAENIARTEMIDAHREADLETRKANKDLLAGWIWMAELSPRTCPACLGMHGTEHPSNERGPLGHPSCRCTALSKTKSWKELGFDLPEPKGVDVTDAKKWFDKQPASVQKGIMGSGRYSAYRSGKIKWDDLAVKVNNPGWRPSYQPAKVA